MTFTTLQHKTWQILATRQLANIDSFACVQFRDGLNALALPLDSIPTLAALNTKIHAATGWTVVRTPVRYLTDRQWAAHMGKKEFPITNFMRTMGELDFTPEPDMFHDIFGHLPLLMNPSVARLIETFSKAYTTGEDSLIPKVAQLWWNTVEFGLIQEGNSIKAFGAGLMSSFGEIQHATSQSMATNAFSIQKGIKKPRAIESFHNAFLVMSSVADTQKQLEAFFASQGVPL